MDKLGQELYCMTVPHHTPRTVGLMPYVNYSNIFRYQWEDPVNMKKKNYHGLNPENLSKDHHGRKVNTGTIQRGTTMDGSKNFRAPGTPKIPNYHHQKPALIEHTIAVPRKPQLSKICAHNSVLHDKFVKGRARYHIILTQFSKLFLTTTSVANSTAVHKQTKWEYLVLAPMAPGRSPKEMHISKYLRTTSPFWRESLQDGWPPSTSVAYAQFPIYLPSPRPYTYSQAVWWPHNSVGNVRLEQPSQEKQNPKTPGRAKNVSDR